MESEIEPWKTAVVLEITRPKPCIAIFSVRKPLKQQIPVTQKQSLYTIAQKLVAAKKRGVFFEF